MRILFRICILLVPLASLAQNGTMVVQLRNGAQMTYRLIHLHSMHFTSTLPQGSTGVVEEDEVSITFNLDQNYPNPFNPSTSIPFTIPSPGVIRAAIYDIAGREVYTFKESFHNAGRHTLVWNGVSSNNIPVGSGVYFWRVQFDNATLTRKMILIK